MTRSNGLTDEEYLARVGRLYQKVLSFRKNDDYTVNQTQMDALLKVVDFFLGLANSLDGQVQRVDLNPAEEFGGVTATFLVFQVSGNKVIEFCNVMRACSCIGIDTLENGDICIDCTIPNVFVRKSDV